VYSVPIGGMLQRLPISIGGSGSTYLYGFVDARFKPNMKKDDCLKFVSEGMFVCLLLFVVFVVVFFVVQHRAAFNIWRLWD
jgi:hypothetical protein